MQPRVSCAGGGGVRVPSFAHPQGAVGSLGQAAGKLQGEARVPQGTPPPRDFWAPRERPGLSAFRQDGVAGSNSVMWTPGKSGYAWETPGT